MKAEPMTDKRIDEPTGTEFVGHEWDGIEELDTPLPRWWLIIFYATVIWAIVWTILYPAWPLINSATQGTLGYSSRGQLEETLAAVEAERAPIRDAIAQTPIEDLRADPQLWQAAINGGASAFRVYCVQCHGTGAAGGPGYPNLNDDDWLWGGDLQSIEYTITHGVRNPDHDETRQSLMPAFGRDGILTDAQIGDLVAYVRTISGQREAGAASQRGAALFEANCAVCHGPAGHGLREFGAPNLTDRIWLYGGDADSIRATITNSRQGVMPRWGHVLDPVTIEMLTAYVWSLGGGEETVATADEGSEAAAEGEGEETVTESEPDERT
jgi:cytochrome c oxidase cbb3-type subunit 3